MQGNGSCEGCKTTGSASVSLAEGRSFNRSFCRNEGIVVIAVHSLSFHLYGNSLLLFVKCTVFLSFRVYRARNTRMHLYFIKQLIVDTVQAKVVLSPLRNDIFTILSEQTIGLAGFSYIPIFSLYQLRLFLIIQYVEIKAAPCDVDLCDIAGSLRDRSVVLFKNHLVKGYCRNRFRHHKCSIKGGIHLLYITILQYRRRKME